MRNRRLTRWRMASSMWSAWIAPSAVSSISTERGSSTRIDFLPRRMSMPSAAEMDSSGSSRASTLPSRSTVASQARCSRPSLSRNGAHSGVGISRTLMSQIAANAMPGLRLACSERRGHQSERQERLRLHRVAGLRSRRANYPTNEQVRPGRPPGGPSRRGPRLRDATLARCFCVDSCNPFEQTIYAQRTQ